MKKLNKSETEIMEILTSKRYGRDTVHYYVSDISCTGHTRYQNAIESLTKKGLIEPVIKEQTWEHYRLVKEI